MLRTPEQASPSSPCASAPAENLGPELSVFGWFNLQGEGRMEANAEHSELFQSLWVETDWTLKCWLAMPGATWWRPWELQTGTQEARRGLTSTSPWSPNLCTLGRQRPLHLSRQQDGSMEAPTSI